ncbi:hypothetical protein ACM3MO_004946 [Escherichia coli]|uniref:Uncharacterized protein n=1 Tax=Salmonella enterica TaxID=28901 RepID=A0A402V188_SALER|nr:hypothetical protein [Salmonella enterica]EKA6783383.1 hypothetical protein [Salmonella enterica]MIU28027.1 hypothetical protein [Salmonella enterica]
MNAGIAVIKVNNIEVGSMPISQYEEIVKSVKKDWRTRVAVVFSYVGFVWKFIIRLWSYFVQSFAVIIALSMLYFFSHPAETTQFVIELRNASSETIAEGIRSVTNICVFLTIIASTLSFFIKGTPVYVSASENSINKKIREVMEVPAEGPVSVTFKKGDGDATR